MSSSLSASTPPVDAPIAMIFPAAPAGRSRRRVVGMTLAHARRAEGGDGGRAYLLDHLEPGS